MSTIDAAFNDRTRGPSLIIWLVGLVVLVFLFWAKFAAIDEIVRSEGELVSSSRPQIIQNLEGGILAEILVHEGQAVEPGQVLARLRGTPFQSNVDDLAEQIDALEIRRLRLEAEMAGEYSFAPSEELVTRAANIFPSELALLNARQSDYVSRLESAASLVSETSRELGVMEDLHARDLAALIEVTRARKTHNEAERSYNEIVTSAELDRANSFSDTLKELATLRQNLRISQDQLTRTTIIAPMRGIVNNLGITTIGGVVRPGEEMFQIIPLDDELFVEAKVKPEDIANVISGQQATIKLTAYDYTIYGSLQGEVTVISADTFKDERRPELGAHYRVTVRVDLSDLGARQQRIEIRPGMQASVELHTGSKTVLQYLTKPLYRSREALREP